MYTLYSIELETGTKTGDDFVPDGNAEQLILFDKKIGVTSYFKFFDYEEKARELAAIEGSPRPEGRGFRLSAKLIEGEPDDWTELETVCRRVVAFDEFGL